VCVCVCVRDHSTTDRVGINQNARVIKELISYSVTLAIYVQYIASDKLQITRGFLPCGCTIN